MFKASVRGFVSVVASLVLVAVVSQSAFAQRGGCNVPQQTNASAAQVNTAAVLSSLAQQQQAIVQNQQARPTFVAAPRAATATATSGVPLVIPPPVASAFAAAPASATAQALPQPAQQRRGLLGRILPPKQVAFTKPNGTSIAVNRQ